MFSGIVAATGRIRKAERRKAGLRLTVVARARKSFDVDVSRETLHCTVGLDKPGEINLEKALRMSDRLGGHLVSGHVDGVGKVTQLREAGADRLLRIRAPRGLARYIARKGSIAVHGVSLTVNAVRGAEFEVNLIPHTLAVTTLKGLRTGDRVNLEMDPLARYAERLLRRK